MNTTEPRTGNFVRTADGRVGIVINGYTDPITAVRTLTILVRGFGANVDADTCTVLETR
jgi:hypothetical protein